MGKSQQHYQKRIWKQVCIQWKIYKSKLKFFNGKINKHFHNNKKSKEGSWFICLSVILIDSVYKKDEKLYPRVFLEECKYVVKEKMKSKFITDNIEVSSDDSDGKFWWRKF